MKISLYRFDKSFLKLSNHWLNDPEIKELTDSNSFTETEQVEWYNSLSKRKDYLIWGIKADSLRIGACGLKNITCSDCEYWGYIGEKNYWGLGIGREILTIMEDLARRNGKSSIWLKVIKNNLRAIALYEKQGFIRESETDRLYFMRKQL